MTQIHTNSHPVLVIVGPSAAGKGTLTKLLFDRCPGKFGRKISTTTRAPRAGEQNGIDYHFVTMDKFNEMELNGEFVETADVHGQKYGTTFASVVAAQQGGSLALLELDVQGVISIHKIIQSNLASNKKAPFEYYAVWITAPDLELLEQRLRGRGTETDDQIQRRLQTAAIEYAFYNEHPDMFRVKIENGDLELAYSSLVKALESLYDAPGMLTSTQQDTPK